jgi:TPR repeat protein
MGDGDACETVGLVYFFGDGAPRDQPRGARAWERSCQLGTADACDQLARVLYAGEGVLPNRPRAEALMLAACEKGSGTACLELARFYDDTAVALPQETRGIEALKRLCKATLDSDSAQACYGWGVLLKHGHGVPQDNGFALKVLQRACNTGSIPDRGCDAVPQE